MAEFQDVMKQWRRMCDKMREQGDWCQSAICPLGGKCQFPSTTDSVTVEKIVMEWAAENPEPVYPSWDEWLLSVGGGKEQTYEVHGYSGNTEVVDFETQVIALNEPIPAETAKRLGVKPKEGTEWEN